ncbi:MAG: hypothetical protein RBG1_1C00001G0931 [candidate division Zixibacteria bacterium RBG-1]|nr:MAG: hypothetical protein RBG1_1C00001G0931 [candidate division Zixibacteria bacterium RBG-1]OGC85427.1 MAG: hypothetical protein A2V73_04935 [candidate division Zixibacteria bacterium RBG_19FT_COMBO_42_43]
MSYRIFLFLVTLAIFLSCAAKNKNLAVVPPPDKFPTEEDSVQIIDKIKFTPTLYLWQDFMPKMSEAGPPFYLTLDMKLENNSDKVIKNLRVEKLTLYYDQTKKELHTFDLEPVVGDSMIPELNTEESKEMHLTNNRSKVFSPQIKEGEKFYARILVWWNGKKKIITTIPVEVQFTY